MTRTILSNNNIYSPTIKSGFRKGTALLAISANFTILGGMPVVLGFDPGSTTRTITMEAVPSPQNDGLEHDIVHYGVGTGNLTINNPAGTQIGTVYPGGYAKLRVINGAWACYFVANQAQPSVDQNDIVTYYTTLAGLANTNVLAIPIPYNFKLLSMGFRIRTPATTAAKLASLQARINGVACTGGLVALTSANATPTNTLVAGSTITALNTGTAGQTVEALVSSVTAFVEGDGQVEWNIQNTG